MGVMNVIVVSAMLGAQAAELPPPYPRPGTTKILENDAVAVWDVAWLKMKYPLHHHRYDLVGISYAEGDRIITQGDAPGRLVPTKAWVFQQNRAGVTHVEEGASDPPMRAVQIEVKSPKPRERQEDPADGLRHVLVEAHDAQDFRAGLRDRVAEDRETRPLLGDRCRAAEQ